QASPHPLELGRVLRADGDEHEEGGRPDVSDKSSTMGRPVLCDANFVQHLLDVGEGRPILVSYLLQGGRVATVARHSCRQPLLEGRDVLALLEDTYRGLASDLETIRNRRPNFLTDVR